ncbi:WD40 repeat-like protein, partial [Aureobasidium melanogenum]
MDPPARHDHTRATIRSTQASFTTAPASPDHHQDMAPYTTMAHVAFAPATQQTVVTTTTTTTVTLPPLLIRPPRDMLSRDPKQYPLASTPTPSSLQRFSLNVGGTPLVYQEAQNVQTSLDKYKQQQAQLQQSNGIIRSQKASTQTHHTPTRAQEFRPPPPKRPASPPSLAEAAELASLHRRKRHPRSLLSRTRSGITYPLADDEQSSISEATSRPMPVTPDTDAAPANDREQQRVSSLTQKAREWQEQHAKQKASVAGPSHSFDRDAATATPPVAEGDLEPVDNPYPRLEQPRPLPAGLLSGSQQDASLPSPSLSPVTAAANLARSHQLLLSTRDADDENASQVSRLDLEDSMMTDQPDAPASSSEATVQSQSHTRQTNQPPLTLMDVPTMIDAYDALPEEMQSYVLYQMLRRSTKKTLRTVASLVNPALKCDPFDVLPVELGLQITKFLDVKSLCRAAQVSKKWRHLIDSDERAWKELLDRDGFNLPEGEIERAVREGWAWQAPSLDGYEEDLGQATSTRSVSRVVELEPLSPLAAPSVSSDDAGSSASLRITRTKRKATSSTGGHKRQKRKVSRRQDDSPLWLRDFQTAQGPMAYASAAAKAVPKPDVGLPSLTNLHLFKSIYQRHYMIAKSWMDSEAKPHHLAFRAHHRHVVTCLLFDSDKILTGSDDTNINVYDTRTGVLRRKLEGHEGGVWALQYEGDTLVSGSTDRSVRIWDIPSGKCLQTFQGHTSTVRCLVILKPVKIGTAADGSPIMMPKEPLIITGSRDSTLRVWKLPRPGDPQIHQAGPPANDSDNPYSLRVLTGHHNSVRAIAAHGDTLVSGSYDCTVRVWKISTGDMVHRLTGHTQKVYSVVLDHDRGRCISGSMDNLVKVWSLETGNCLFNLDGHTSLVGLLDLSHGRLVSAAADSTLRIWDPDNGNCQSILSAHTGAITCFQHDDQKVISGSDRTLKMWNISTGECLRDLLSDLSGVWQVRFDERRCVAAVQRNNLTYIEVLDFGAARDGVPENKRGHRIVVDPRGREIEDIDATAEVQAAAAGG